MAGIGIRLTAAVFSEGADLQRYKFSSFTERADSGMTLRRQAGQSERAIAGIPSTAEVHGTLEEVSIAAYEWLVGRLGFPIQLRLPGFSARVVLKSADRIRVSAMSDETAWGVRVVLFVVERN